MKERPILFNTEMVRAILEGRKTQTRRLVKPQPTVCDEDRGGHWWPSNAVQSMVHVEKELQDYKGLWRGLIETCNPFGEVGDQLWVRETWYQKGTVGRSYPDDDEYQFFGHKQAAYVADGEAPNDWTVKKRPSIHMPRWASRIQLEITNIRIERLKDISEADAIAEGMTFTDYGQNHFGNPNPGWLWKQSSNHDQCLMTARHAFGNLWESINGKGSWDENPWVWVVEFNLIQGGAV
ncbi:hypothetical protein AWW72_18075 [Acinetobacter sp. NRRL B-65365]|uniref:hypothetical protein n=1 Tax=Acinetobacter sp. NRRL B-65365 TaxID=1785092 RepID=UPI0007A08944|nr:hypothetical protein [Acinetobacter sp. NRRL B-65365]KYQ82514.1 hypothetical protein AWW72_18075 [Acinetobacter sp. NRRL B-65365]